MQKQPISILQFTNATARGGAEEHIRRLLQGLDRNLFRLNFVCPPALASQLQRDIPPDVGLYPLDVSRPTQIAAMFRLAQILRRCRVDILHSHMFYSSLFASPIGWLMRVPVIIETAHGREAWRRGWKARFFIDRLVGKTVDQYIAVSEANARYLVESKRFRPEKIEVIYPGCDVDGFDPAHRAPAGLKSGLGLLPDDPVLVCIGRLEPQKGHHVLLDAMPAVRASFPRVHLVCVGDGDLRAALEKQTRDLGLDGAVSFVGYHRNVQDWLALADVSLLPSYYEGLPGTAIESLACERPIVATAVDGTPEVVIDGKTGLTVPPGNPARLAEAICRLLRDPEWGRQLAAAGRKWVLEKFTREQLICRTQQFYVEVWERHLKRSQTVNRSVTVATQ